MNFTNHYSKDGLSLMEHYLLPQNQLQSILALPKTSLPLTNPTYANPILSNCATFLSYYRYQCSSKEGLYVMVHYMFLVHCKHSYWSVLDTYVSNTTPKFNVNKRCFRGVSTNLLNKASCHVTALCT